MRGRENEGKVGMRVEVRPMGGGWVWHRRNKRGAGRQKRREKETKVK